MAYRSFLALRAADDAMPATPDLPVRADLPIDLFALVTGSDRLRSAFYNLSAIAAAGGDDPLGRGDCPEWHTDSQGRSTVKLAELRREKGGSLLGVEVEVV